MALAGGQRGLLMKEGQACPGLRVPFWAHLGPPVPMCTGTRREQAHNSVCDGENWEQLGCPLGQINWNALMMEKRRRGVHAGSWLER